MKIADLSQKISLYLNNPGVILHDVRYLYYKTRYYVEIILDPPPKQGKKELTADYFERIDPKYGLRFYKAMIGISTNIDLSDALPKIDEMYSDNKTRRIMKDFLITVADVEQKNRENYKKYLIRTELLKSQNP